MASNPTMPRHQRPRVHPAFSIFALFAALGSPALALEAPYPPRITPPVGIAELPSTLVVDAAAVTAAPDADFVVKSHNANELRLRHMHQHQNRRFNRRKEEETEDEESSSSSTGKEDKESSKTASDDDEKESKTKSTDDEKETKSSSKDEDEDGDKASKTKSEDEEKETKSSSKDNEDDETSVAPTKTLTEDDDSLSTRSLSLATSTDATATATSDPDAPLPIPFDGTSASSFNGDSGDDSCSSFISSLLGSDRFGECYPISMLILKSDSFFDAKRQLTSMVRVLDAGCSANVDTCTDFMNEAAQNLTASENCQDEYKDGVTVVMEAYHGLKNYEVIYSATCLQNPDDDQYCYASAVTNSSSASDSYLYFLPYGLALPGSSTPSCSWCNQETMGIFHAASAHRNLQISETYEDAARIFNNLCDLNYVNSTLADAVEDVGMALLPSSTIMMSSVAIAAILATLL